MDILRQASVLSPMGLLIANFLIGISIILLFKWYFSRYLNYWKERGVPSVTSYPLRNIRRPFHDVELERYKEHGRIYGHFEFKKALLSVAEPELLRDVLVKDFNVFTGRRRFSTGDNVMESMVSLLQGEDWKRVRTIITPTFTTGKIKRTTGIFKECSMTVVKNFKQAAEKGESIDVKKFYGAFTMDVIASSAFSTKLDSYNDPDNKFVTVAREIFTTINWRFIMFALFPRLMKFFRIRVFWPKAKDFFTDVTLQIIEERKRTGQTRNDFLQLLLDTAKEMATEEKKSESTDKEKYITENYETVEEDIVFKNIVSKKTLSRDELVAQCIAFFIAGYDTTASTLTFASYLLALHPEIQEKLIQEVDDALRQNDGEVTYEAIQGMKYLDNVISETLRLYPPAIRIERVAEEDYKLGDTGITVPKDMIITIPVYAIQRDPEFFPDPEKFDPDRFSSEERAKRNPYTYLPFGAGPRNCIGMRFALIEIKMCLAHVLRNFRIKKSPQTKVPLEFLSLQGLLQPRGIILDMEVRKDAVKSL